MKITIDLTGATPVAPDYAMLRAALVAAQAATPTARASHSATAPAIDTGEALHALFARGGRIDASADALRHRFREDIAETAPGALEHDERALNLGISTFVEAPAVETDPTTLHLTAAKAGQPVRGPEC